MENNPSNAGVVLAMARSVRSALCFHTQMSRTSQGDFESASAARSTQDLNQQQEVRTAGPGWRTCPGGSRINTHVLGGRFARVVPTSLPGETSFHVRLVSLQQRVN
jgi:hypothetical protein